MCIHGIMLEVSGKNFSKNGSGNSHAKVPHFIILCENFM